MTDRDSILSARMRSLSNSNHAAPIIVASPTPTAPPSTMLLTLAETARELRVSIPTLRKMGLPLVSLSARVVRVRRCDLEALIAGGGR